SDLAHVGDPLNFYRCHTAAVRKKNLASPATQAEVYRIIAYIHRQMGVPPGKLEEVLEARGERFVKAAWDQKFGAAEAWKVYWAAREVDSRAWRRIMLRWARMRAGSVRRRLVAKE